MIIFFDKRDGSIFAHTDGRVHDELGAAMHVDPGIGEENIGKYIIGWTIEGDQHISHNLDKMDLLIKFEDNSPTSPLGFKIDPETGDFIEFDKQAK